MRKRLLTLSICVLAFALSAHAQHDAARQWYEDFKQQAKEEYADFRDRANREYADFVAKAWEEYNAMPALPRPKDETVPPVVLPEGDEDKPIDSNPVPIRDIVAPPSPHPQPVPPTPIEEQPVTESEVLFTYCGTPCMVRFPASGAYSIGDCGNDALSQAWTILAGKEYNNMLRDCLSLRAELQLSDWAYLNLLSAFSVACLGKCEEATFLAAFIYCQSGYQMRIGRGGGRLYLLFASRHAIYGKSYFPVGNERFYVFDSEADRLDICGASFPEERPLSLYIPWQQRLAFNETSPRRLTAKRYADMAFAVAVNANQMDFYASYPASEADGDFMTRWAMYANAPMDEMVAGQLYPAMRAKLQGLGELEAVERLLNWVQTAFTYEYDDKVWGGDRAFFAEESLYYPYCDCEDRSILFTRLVRDLLGLECILVYYPGHLASAVRFAGVVEGDYIMLGGSRYTVCDPTYIGARVGMTMPGMDNSGASVILLD